MFAVGLTGGIGSGKTSVADLLAAHGAAVVDSDAIAHALTAPGGAAIEPIRTAFGAGFIAPDGSLDRAAMRARVFAQREDRALLEAILHPMIRARAIEEAQAARTAPYVVFVVPLLVEFGGWRDRVDRVLVVDCDEATQIARVVARSRLDEAQVRAILAAQASRAQRLAAADDVIDNAGPQHDLAPAVARLHVRYVDLARIKTAAGR